MHARLGAAACLTLTRSMTFGIVLVSTVLLIPFAGSLADEQIELGRGKQRYRVKYSGTWPNCENLACLDERTLAQMRQKCDEDPTCTGFTFEQDADFSGGCLKACGDAEFGGFGEGRYNYFVPVDGAEEQIELGRKQWHQQVASSTDNRNRVLVDAVCFESGAIKRKSLRAFFENWFVSLMFLKPGAKLSYLLSDGNMYGGAARAWEGCMCEARVFPNHGLNCVAAPNDGTYFTARVFQARTGVYQKQRIKISRIGIFRADAAAIVGMDFQRVLIWAVCLVQPAQASVFDSLVDAAKSKLASLGYRQVTLKLPCTRHASL